MLLLYGISQEDGLRSSRCGTPSCIVDAYFLHCEPQKGNKAWPVLSDATLQHGNSTCLGFALVIRAVHVSAGLHAQLVWQWLLYSN